MLRIHPIIAKYFCIKQEEQEDISPSLAEQHWEKKIPEPLSWRSDEEDEDSDFGEEQRDCYLKVQHQLYEEMCPLLVVCIHVVVMKAFYFSSHVYFGQLSYCIMCNPETVTAGPAEDGRRPHCGSRFQFTGHLCIKLLASVMTKGV